MDALAICRQLHAAGVRVSTDGGKLLAGPADRLTDELRGLIRAHKPELLEFLANAHETTEALLNAAMQACDRHGDGEAARQDMRDQCLATPLHLQADLLEHFTGKRAAGLLLLTWQPTRTGRLAMGAEKYLPVAGLLAAGPGQQ